MGGEGDEGRGEKQKRKRNLFNQIDNVIIQGRIIVGISPPVKRDRNLTFLSCFPDSFAYIFVPSLFSTIRIRGKERKR